MNISKSGHSGENTATDLKVLRNSGPNVASDFNWESTSPCKWMITKVVFGISNLIPGILPVGC